MYELVDELSAALRQLGWSTIDRLRPAAEHDQLRLTAGSINGFDPEWVDDTIDAWWSWHNGALDVNDRGHPVSISPDGLAVHNFENALQSLRLGLDDAFEEDEEMLRELASEIFESPVIPLVGSADVMCLRKPSGNTSDPWEIWSLSKSMEWHPWATSDGSNRTLFEEYLQTLISRIRSQEMVFQPLQGIVGRNRDSAYLMYPWR